MTPLDRINICAQALLAQAAAMYERGDFIGGDAKTATAQRLLDSAERLRRHQET